MSLFLRTEMLSAFTAEFVLGLGSDLSNMRAVSVLTLFADMDLSV